MKKNKLKNILILGKLPPPIGGVTIHIERLLNFLEFQDISSQFIPLSFINLLRLPFLLLFNRCIVHLHTSNPVIRFYIAILIKLIPNCFLIITYHGDIGRFGKLKNSFDLWSISICDIPIVLNQKSLVKAKHINSKTTLVSAFIAPPTPLPDKKLNDIIKKFRISNYNEIFCTNAFNVSYDKNQQEIYGISDLVHIFDKFPNYALLVSDPSGNYKKFIKESSLSIPQNVLFIDFPHDFAHILKTSGTFIRATTTDGDSLSVREALFFNIRVIASDCVDRPKGVDIFKTGDLHELEKLITMGNSMNQEKCIEIIDGTKQILDIYRRF